MTLALQLHSRAILMSPARTWATTAEVCDAAKIATSTAFLWAKRGVLPAPTTVAGGKRGRSSRWPHYTPEQARWVASHLEDGFTFSEIAAMLERGEFRPSSSGAAPPPGGPGDDKAGR